MQGDTEQKPQMLILGIYVNANTNAKQCHSALHRPASAYTNAKQCSSFFSLLLLCIYVDADAYARRCRTKRQMLTLYICVDVTRNLCQHQYKCKAASLYFASPYIYVSTDANAERCLSFFSPSSIPCPSLFHCFASISVPLDICLSINVDAKWCRFTMHMWLLFHISLHLCQCRYIYKTVPILLPPFPNLLSFFLLLPLDIYVEAKADAR